MDFKIRPILTYFNRQEQMKRNINLKLASIALD